MLTGWFNSRNSQLLRFSIQLNSCECTSSLFDIHPLISFIFLANLMQKIDKMYATFTGQPLEKVQQYTERDRFLSVSEVTLLVSFTLSNKKLGW